MKNVLLASVLLASLFFFGCIQQGDGKVPAVSIESIGTPTPYVAPTAEPTKVPTAEPTAEILTEESDQSADTAIEETEALDATGTDSSEGDVDASDLDIIG